VQRFEVSGAVRPIYVSLGVKRLIIDVSDSPYGHKMSAYILLNTGKV